MDAKLKQRLAGAVTLASLAIIILPWLLDGTPEERLTVDIPLPPRVALAELTVQEVQRRMAQAEQASEARLPKEAADDTDYGAGPDFVLDRNGLPVLWSLQVGAFQDRENATRLRTQLRGENWRVYILHARRPAGDMYRVFVGPLSSKDALAQLNGAIKEKFGLAGRLVRHDVKQDGELLDG